MAAAEVYANNVRWADDTAINTSFHNEQLEPQDDVFYLSRLNDPTTYFFQWICKRYNLTVKSEALSCPICLETSQNNIQLSCGHTFCRQCLKAAAQREMSSCALCRKSHTLDPDVLRKQFNEQRFANLSWRLGKTRATRTFSKPQWEQARAGAISSSTPNSPHHGRKSCDGGEGSHVQDDDMMKKEKSASSSTIVIPEGDRYDGPDIGALPRSLLMFRAHSYSKKVAFLNKDCGASTADELRQRWHHLLATSSIAPDAGALPVETSVARWSSSTSGTNSMDVGGETSASLHSRWQRNFTSMACLSPDCGASETEELTQRWKDLAQHFSTTDVGALPSLQSTWSHLMSSSTQIGQDVGATAKLSTLSSSSSLNMGTDIGGLTEEDLRVLASARMPSPLSVDCGAQSIQEMTRRWQSLKAMMVSSIHYDVGALPVISKASSLSASGLPLAADCGEASQTELMDRWRKLASWKDDDIGALSAGELAARWKALQGWMTRDGGNDDAGAKSIKNLTGRWNALMHSIPHGNDVGGCEIKELKESWMSTINGGIRV